MLGLDSCPLSDEEIVRAIEEASQKHLSEIEFLANGHIIKIRPAKIQMRGIF